MSTKNIVPRNANEGQLGTTAKPWASIVATELDAPTGKFSRFTVVEADCINGSNMQPLSGTGIGTTVGTLVVGTSTADHPGVMIFKSSVAANSGYQVAAPNSYSQMLIAGGETYEVIFAVETTGNTTARLGYHDTNTATAPVDGVYLQIVETALTGIARSNNSETVTADTVTLTQGVLYRAKLVLNADATLATFTLFTCADGQPVSWVNNAVASNIPTGAGRYIMPDMIATNSGTSAVNLMSLDWFRFSIDRVLVR